MESEIRFLGELIVKVFPKVLAKVSENAFDHVLSATQSLATISACSNFIKGIGDILQEDKAKNHVFVFCSVHVTHQELIRHKGGMYCSHIRILPRTPPVIGFGIEHYLFTVTINRSSMALHNCSR